MIDKEKVIKEMEFCLEHGLDDGAKCSKCQYYSTAARVVCKMVLLHDAHELLKEPDAVKPIRSNESWYCGHCFERVGETRAYANATGAAGIQKVRHKYCPECGRKVKWE